MSMAKRLYLYPVWIRLWHLCNALLFLILILTGISMQFASVDGYLLLMSFQAAVTLHNVAAIILTVNYVVFVIGNKVTGNGKYYKIERKGFMGDLMRQGMFYAFGMFKKEEHPFPVTEENKFNPLQKISYVLAMYVGLPIIIITGLGLLFPEILIRQFFGVSGLLYTDILHITMGFILSVFLMIHIYTCTLGEKVGTLFMSMINGYHEHHD